MNSSLESRIILFLLLCKNTIKIPKPIIKYIVYDVNIYIEDLQKIKQD